MKHILHFGLYCGLIVLTVWLIGFIMFCAYALSLQSDTSEQHDAVVVLTGGNNRVQTGLQLMTRQKADYLLISGVNKKVKRAQLLKKVPKSQQEKITLGYAAENTVGNAREIQDWILKNKIDSISLVTSFYHMPRSIFEISKRNPSLKISPCPVFPKSFGDSVDWIKTRYAWLLFIEYHKFIFVHLASLFKGVE